MSREYIRIYAVKDVRQRVPCPRDTVAVCPQDSQRVCDYYVVRPRLCADVHVVRPRRCPRVSGRMRPRDMVATGTDVTDIVWHRIQPRYVQYH